MGAPARRHPPPAQPGRRLHRGPHADPLAVEEAVLATKAKSHKSVDKRRKEVAAVEAELRKSEAAAERYMVAFESGAVTQEMFGDRVRELGQKAASLRARRDDLLAQLAAADPAVPTPEAIGSVRANLAEAETAPKPLKKALAHTFVEQLKVPERRVHQAASEGVRSAAAAGRPGPRPQGGHARGCSDNDTTGQPKQSQRDSNPCLNLERVVS